MFLKAYTVSTKLKPNHLPGSPFLMNNANEKAET